MLVVSIVSAAASGGGRELLPRDQGVAFPVSATTDHLGALLMAPLNIAWLLQAWSCSASTSYVVGPVALVCRWPCSLPGLVWLVTARRPWPRSLAWCVEWVRRGPPGVL